MKNRNLFLITGEMAVDHYSQSQAKQDGMTAPGLPPMALALGILAQVPLWTTVWLEGGQDRVGNLPQPGKIMLLN